MDHTGANTVETSILQRISHFGLGAAAPSRTYMDPPVLVVTNFFSLQHRKIFCLFPFPFVEIIYICPKFVVLNVLDSDGDHCKFSFHISSSSFGLLLPLVPEPTLFAILLDRKSTRLNSSHS